MLFDSFKNRLELMLAGLLRNILFPLHKKSMNSSEMKRMIDALPEPSNDYDRCYQQYQCIFRNGSKVRLFFRHCAGLLAIPFFLALYAVNRLLLRPSVSRSAILINSDDRFGNIWNCFGLLPNELKKEFPDLKEVRQRLYPPLLDGVLGMDALKVWLYMALRHPLKGYMNLNILIHVMFANRLLLLYHPKAFIVLRMEMNCASSMLTMFCERNGCEVILLMHGELVVDASTAFSRFSRMYIWDEHYRDIIVIQL